MSENKKVLEAKKELETLGDLFTGVALQISKMLQAFNEVDEPEQLENLFVELGKAMDKHIEDINKL